MGFLYFILFTIFENNQHEYQIFNSFISYNYFKEVLASDEEENDEKDLLEQKICNKLFESEACENIVNRAYHKLTIDKLGHSFQP